MACIHYLCPISLIPISLRGGGGFQGLIRLANSCRQPCHRAGMIPEWASCASGHPPAPAGPWGDVPA
eukprot:scaffold300511_cov17-Tisochrysis_lutea.AAC.2